MKPHPTAGDWAAVAGDPEPPNGEWWTTDALAPGRLDEARAILEAAARDGVTGPLKAGGVTWTYRPFDAAPLPDSPAPSLRRWIVFVGIGLALAGVWLVWRVWS